MSWLHTWSGLVLGWLLFAIFVTGTLSFFQNEITFWMQPELHKADSRQLALDRALHILGREASDASQWTLTLPGPRNPTLGLTWQSATLPVGGNNAQHGGKRAGSGERAPTPQNASGHGQQGGGGNRGPRIVLDPASGDVLQARETAGGGFLYRFHFELYGMDRLWGRWIVGIATMFMFVAIISGVIVHRNIFRDFFTFRPAKGKRSWLDAHNASSVMSLPFHIIITFSGLLLFGNMMIPTALQSVYRGDSAAYRQEMRAGMMMQALPPSGERAPLTDLVPLIASAEKTWGGQSVGSITITNPGDREAVIELRRSSSSSLAAGRGGSQTLRFSGVDGQSLGSAAATPPSTVQAISNTLIMLHRGFFASPMVRWLLFFAGVGGSVMIASGLAMWVIARTKKQEQASRAARFGHRLVEVLNVAGIAGLLIAIGAYFWANRLIPANWSGRGEWEIKVFFCFWVASIVHALIRRHKVAWIEQLVFAGLLLALLPFLSTVTGVNSMFKDRWILAGFDLCAILIGVSLLFAARKVYLHRPGNRMERAVNEAATDSDEFAQAPTTPFPEPLEASPDTEKAGKASSPVEPLFPPAMQAQEART
jgi:uncharacterized iron-regulated membrane protein